MPKKPTRTSLAAPDDPIFKEGPTFYTPLSARPALKRLILKEVEEAGAEAAKPKQED